MKKGSAAFAHSPRPLLGTKTQVCEGLVLSARPMGEKDKLIELFSPQLGRVKLLAKSAASYRSKLRGCLDPTTHIRCQLYQGRSFALVTEVSVVFDFPGIRLDFDRISVAAYCMTIIKRATSFDQPNPELFRILFAVFSQLDSGHPTRPILSSFHTAVLQSEGLWDKSELVSDSDFITRFSDYCGTLISLPLLIS